jgi:hypothetical protein
VALPVHCQQHRLGQHGVIPTQQDAPQGAQG